MKNIISLTIQRSGLALLILLGVVSSAWAFDFKGLVLGEPTTAAEVEARFAECVGVSGQPCDELQKTLHEKTKSHVVVVQTESWCAMA